jgi:hypothetical protein
MIILDKTATKVCRSSLRIDFGAKDSILFQVLPYSNTTIIMDGYGYHLMNMYSNGIVPLTTSMYDNPR